MSAARFALIRRYCRTEKRAARRAFYLCSLTPGTSRLLDTDPVYRALCAEMDKLYPLLPPACQAATLRPEGGAL